MRQEPLITLSLTRRDVAVVLIVLAVVAAFAVTTGPLFAQKVQSDYSDKFDIAVDDSGVGIATSADGKHVYVVGPKGVIVSSSFGTVGSWKQTVRLK